MMWKKYIFGILVFVLLTPSAFAKADLPAPTGFVNDFANIISDPVQNQLEQELIALQKRTGVQVAIATVTTLDGRAIEDYSLDLARTWGIGDKKKDSGLLMIVAPNEKEIRIEVGYGLEGFVTDAQSSWIIRETMIPAFRNGDFESGISLAIDRIQKALEGIEEIPSDSLYGKSKNDLMQFGMNNLFILLFFILPWFAAIFGPSKRWWPGGVVGGVTGLVLWLAWGITAWTILGFGIFGLILDYAVSKNHQSGKHSWWAGGGFGGRGGGGGFGGFGGGGFGGGGASGRW